MICRFRLQGGAARKHPEFSYRLPIMRPFDPRELLTIEIGPKTVDLADCEWILHAADPDGLAVAELKLTPNDYTLAREARVVLVKRVLNGNLFWRQYQDDMIKEAFE